MACAAGSGLTVRPEPGVREALRARYGAAIPERATLARTATIERLLAHATVRAYRDRPLPEGTLEALVAAAQSASSSSNLQCWSVVAVRDPERRARLAKLANQQAHVAAAPLVLAWVADQSRNRRVGEAAGETLVGLGHLETFLIAAIDAALAAQNAVVAAESLGLGTCYIGAMRNHPEAVAAELALPPGAAVMFGLTVGWPDPARPAQVKPRLPQGVVLHMEQYGAADEPALLAEYDATLTGFQRREGMAEQGWQALVRSRLGSIKALSGRERLREALRTLGLLAG